jgi:hypothetical protein
VNPDHVCPITQEHHNHIHHPKLQYCLRGHSKDDAYVSKGIRSCRTCARLKYLAKKRALHAN